MKPKRSQLLVVLAAVVAFIIILTFFKLSTVLSNASLQKSQAPEQPATAIEAVTIRSDPEEPRQGSEADAVSNSVVDMQPSAQSDRSSVTSQQSQTLTKTQLAGYKHPAASHKDSEVLRILAHRRNHCDAELEHATKYNFVDRRKVDWAWCNDKIKKHKIQMGLSWGTLSTQDQKTW